MPNAHANRQSSAPVQRQSADKASLGSRSFTPPALQLLASSENPLQRQEQDCDLGFTPGELTIQGEGAGPETLTIHWPGNAASGVTIGYGYDLGQRTREGIRADLVRAGLPQNQIDILVRAQGVTGSAAGAFVRNNRAAFGNITEAQRVSLFQNILPEYEGRAEGRATTTFYNAGAGHFNEDWQLTTEEWNNLHPAIHELITDLTFQGAYSNNSAWGGTYAAINPILKSSDDDITKMERLVAVLQAYLQSGNLPSGAPRRTNLRIQMLQGAIAAARSCQVQ